MPSNYNYQDGESIIPFEDRFVSADLFFTGNLWSWGRGVEGQVGNNKTGNFANQSGPYETYYSQLGWKSGSVYGNSYPQNNNNLDRMNAITIDGKLYGWGTGALLGNGSPDTKSVPTRIGYSNDWKQISCGKNVTAAIKTNGTLWTWGNSYEVLGTNTATVSSTPVTTFAGGTDWKQASCGTNSVAAIKTDGTLWVWGTGNLGINRSENSITPVTTFAGGNNWKQVSNGHGYSVAIKTDGTLWAWGSNTWSNLGINHTTDSYTSVTTFAGGTNWKQVSCGQNCSAAIKTDGTLWTWGINFRGQLGTNDSVDRYTPVTTFGGGNDWKIVEMIGSSCFGIRTNGSLWVWGYDAYGQLGVSGTDDKLTPVQVDIVTNGWKTIFSGHDSASIGALTFEGEYLSS